MTEKKADVMPSQVSDEARMAASMQRLEGIQSHVLDELDEPTKAILDCIDNAKSFEFPPVAEDDAENLSDRENRLLDQNIELRDKLEELQKDRVKKSVPKGPSQSERLVSIGMEADLFHFGHEAYASVQIKGHQETCRLRSTAFTRWLAKTLYERQRGMVPSAEAINGALLILEAIAIQEGKEQRAHIRIAEYQGSIYVDLADAEWRQVKISFEGWWEIIEAQASPVKFLRPAGMQALPQPETGGSLDDLKKYVNVAEDDLPLLYGWLVGCLREFGPFPILVLIAEKGAGKSTLARILRLLIDPNEVPIQTLPRDENDLMTAAYNSWLINVDNISNIDQWLADGFCRLATGGGLRKKKLYTDTEEIIFSAMRPIILNGISDLTRQTDLADRSIVLNLSAIAEEDRRPEEDFWAEFNDDRPFILGAIFTAVAGALSRRRNTKLAGYPRMADFARWVVAAEPDLPIKKGSFLEAYESNCEDLVMSAVENDRFAMELVKLAHAVRKQHKEWPYGPPPSERRIAPEGSPPGEWLGTATQLLDELKRRVEESVLKSKGFPKSSNALSRKLRDFASNLRAIGVNVIIGRTGGRNGARFITLSVVADLDG